MMNVAHIAFEWPPGVCKLNGRCRFRVLTHGWRMADGGAWHWDGKPPTTVPQPSKSAMLRMWHKVGVSVVVVHNVLENAIHGGECAHMRAHHGTFRGHDAQMIKGSRDGQCALSSEADWICSARPLSPMPPHAALPGPQ